MVVEANRIAKGFNDLIAHNKAKFGGSGFFEYYNPITGDGLGKRDQTWAGLPLEMPLLPVSDERK